MLLYQQNCYDSKRYCVRPFARDSSHEQFNHVPPSRCIAHLVPVISCAFLPTSRPGSDRTTSISSTGPANGDLGYTARISLTGREGTLVHPSGSDFGARWAFVKDLLE